MAGNGYFNQSTLRYEPKSVETWDDFDASSTGNDWDSITSWNGTPDLPLTFTTEIEDFGRIENVNYTITVGTNHPVYTTVYYGDTIDSTGGSIDSVSSINVSPSQTLSAVKARYFQFAVSIDRDSAAQETPYIETIDIGFGAELVSRQLTDIDTRDLVEVQPGFDDAAFYELPQFDGISKVTSIVTQPQLDFDDYVIEDYVAPDDSTFNLYVEGINFVPVIGVDKSTTPMRIRVLGVTQTNQTSSQRHCVFDAVVQGLPELTSDADGNITQAL